MKSNAYIKSTYFLIGIFAFFYVFIRAFMIGITYDEVWTINEFVSQKFIDIINYTPCDANNHIVNTILIKLFFSFGNKSLFIARLPNVLAFIMYLIYGYKITYRYLPPFIGIVCFLLLLLNPFLLDFFSIARGYGLSLGFLMASVYYTFHYINNGTTANVWKATGLAAIAVLCNFSLLNYWISLVFILNLVALLSSSKYNFKKTFFYSLIVTIILTIISYEPIRKLNTYGNLYYGGNTNFYSDTLTSLAKYSFYNQESNSFITYSLNIFLLILILSIITSFFVRDSLYSLKNTILSITVVSILSVITQHYLFGTLYLIDRTALFLYPLFILILCFSFNNFSTLIKKLGITLVTLAFTINFCQNANFKKTAIWYFDAHTSEILTIINEEGKKQNRKLAIDFSWPFQSSVGYYIEKNRYPYIEIIKNKDDREDLNSNTDYYIYLTKSLEKVGYDANNQKILSLQRDTFMKYNTENIIVFENLKKN